MKKLSAIFIGLILIILLIILLKTLFHPFNRFQPAAKTFSVGSMTNASVEKLAGGLRLQTISNVDSSLVNFSKFDSFQLYLRKAYPQVYSKLTEYTVNRYGLVFKWKGKDSSLKPILFLSHYDVVPPGTANTIDSFSPVLNLNEEALPPLNGVATIWDYAPFSGAIAKGRIYGRGALDMKGMLFSIMEASDSLIT